jgi:hypothetical protein
LVRKGKKSYGILIREDKINTAIETEFQGEFPVPKSIHGQTSSSVIPMQYFPRFVAPDFIQAPWIVPSCILPVAPSVYLFGFPSFRSFRPKVSAVRRCRPFSVSTAAE